MIKSCSTLWTIPSI